MFTTRIRNLISSTRRNIFPLMLAVLFAPPFQSGGGDFCTLLTSFKTFAMQLAFIGTVAGLIVFGIMKVWSIISPDSGNQGRDYLKNLGIGILLIAGSGAIATMVFNAIDATAIACTVN